MKTLLHLTPRLVVLSLLITLFISPLLANERAAVAGFPPQNAAGMATCLLVLLLAIVLPLTKKRNVVAGNQPAQRHPNNNAV